MVFGQRAVESKMRENRVNLNHSVDEFFDLKTITLKFKPKKGDDTHCDELLDENGCVDVSRPVIYCKDINGLVQKIIKERDLDPQNIVIKIGADDGQGIFKINLQILSSANSSHTPNYQVCLLFLIEFFLYANILTEKSS